MNLTPNASIFTLLAQYYAKHNDGPAIQLLFQEIQEHRTRVNRPFYQIAMDFFAKRGEVETLQSLSDHATLKGITLNAHTYPIPSHTRTKPSKRNHPLVR